ncbi:hypothetical protein L2744_00815 [Shewanella profunda]|uniref:hypothetical protein n=1 Tax=Shewanella profunda TaxID=254793 RepID=UPI00200C27F6|nr:hypothetical protein [Shewanella profunda]MCL1088175.1 hypothetical protein [Shewanella profunda]
MNDPFVESLLTAYTEIKLSAWDNLRLVLSECAHHECEARGFEVEFVCDSGQSLHYWAQVGNIWLDCGRTNAYSVAIEYVTADDFERVKVKNNVECALLSQEQIGLLCMQNAHFDHC